MRRSFRVEPPKSRRRRRRAKHAVRASASEAPCAQVGNVIAADPKRNFVSSDDRGDQFSARCAEALSDSKRSWQNNGTDMARRMRVLLASGMEKRGIHESGVLGGRARAIQKPCGLGRERPHHLRPCRNLRLFRIASRNPDGEPVEQASLRLLGDFPREGSRLQRRRKRSQPDQTVRMRIRVIHCDHSRSITTFRCSSDQTALRGGTMTVVSYS